MVDGRFSSYSGVPFIQWAIFPSGFSFPCTIGPFLSVGFRFCTVSNCVLVDFVFGTVGEFFGNRVLFFYNGRVVFQ